MIVFSEDNMECPPGINDVEWEWVAAIKGMVRRMPVEDGILLS